MDKRADEPERARKKLTPVEFAEWLLNTRPKLAVFVTWVSEDPTKRKSGAVDTIVRILNEADCVDSLVALKRGPFMLTAEDHYAFAGEVLNIFLAPTS